MAYAPGSSWFQERALKSRGATPGDPYGQNQLLFDMIRGYQKGQGEFGLGAAARQGTSTIAQMLAQRNIRPGSGVGMGALSNMMGGAMALDAGNRRNYGMQLASLATPQTRWERNDAMSRGANEQALLEQSRRSGTTLGDFLGAGLSGGLGMLTGGLGAGGAAGLMGLLSGGKKRGWGQQSFNPFTPWNPVTFG